MATSRLLCGGMLAACWASACASNGSHGMTVPDAGERSPDAGAAPETGAAACTPASDPFSAAELAVIRSLSPLPAAPPPDPTNRYADDPAASRLGQKLFFDKTYSGPLAVGDDGSNGGAGAMGETGRLSCASCHVGQSQDDRRSRPGSVSLGADYLTRNSPTLVNASYYSWTNWAGRFSAQWELPPAVAENARNMNSGRLKIAHLVFDHYRADYEAVFGGLEPAIGADPARFPPAGKPKAAGAADGPWELMAAADRAVVDRILVNYGKAIAAYLRRLVSADSRFDRYVAGTDSALDCSEKRGLRLFVGKAGCVTCHQGPTLSDGRFHALAVPQLGDHVPAVDNGRFADIPALLASPFNSAGSYSDDPAAGAARLQGLTAVPSDETKGQFRTASLRQVALTPPYMHNGALPTLADVIDYYDRGGSPAGAGNKDPALEVLGLGATEKADLGAFLATLTGQPLPAALIAEPGP
jgi:cytochrome c peroxidase